MIVEVFEEGRHTHRPISARSRAAECRQGVRASRSSPTSFVLCQLPTTCVVPHGSSRLAVCTVNPNPAGRGRGTHPLAAGPKSHRELFFGEWPCPRARPAPRGRPARVVALSDRVVPRSTEKSELRLCGASRFARRLRVGRLSSQPPRGPGVGGSCRAEGDPVDQIARAAESRSVKLVVAGAHRSPDGRGPGFVTRQPATRLRQPLLVVPPEATVPTSLERVVFAIEGTAATTAPICALFEQFAFDPNTDLVAVHSFALNDAPRYADHQPYDYGEWCRAIEPYLPDRFDGGVVFRAGAPEQTVPDEAAALGATLTVVSWSQVFASGRAPLVNKLARRLEPSDPACSGALRHIAGVF